MKTDKVKKLEESSYLKDKLFRKRTAEQILQEGLYPTCSDFVTVYRALMIGFGVPTSYYETFHSSFIKDEKVLYNHSINKVFDGNGNSIIVDPMIIKIYYSEQELFDETQLIPFKEGLDS